MLRPVNQSAKEGIHEFLPKLPGLASNLGDTARAGGLDCAIICGSERAPVGAPR
jgi:hypothetical protein